MTLWLLLGLAALTGLIVLPAWRRGQASHDGLHYLHGAAGALLLVALLMQIDNSAPADGRQLLAIFLSIATGILMFLQRQRQQHFSRLTLALHLAFGAAIVALLLL